MDYQSIVSGSTAAGCGPAECDQAIFTSIRSRVGQGYRLVSASPGLTAEEKREITRRCPSHGNLCADGEEASAVSGYPLPGGRHCVALSRHAGLEHTARGGLRVHTAVVVLDAAGYAAFDCDPLRVQRAVAAFGAEILDNPPPVLPKLRLEAGPQRLQGPSEAAEHALYLLSALLCGRRLVVIGAADGLELARVLIAGLPVCTRRRLAVSIGLKFAPTRQMDLSIVDRDEGETRRLLRGQDIELYDLADPPGRAASAFDPWISFIERMWLRAQHADLQALTRRIDESAGAQTLARITALCAGLERLPRCDLPELTKILQTIGPTTGQTQVERDLAAAVLAAAEERQARLEQAPPRPAPAPMPAAAPAPARSR